MKNGIDIPAGVAAEVGLPQDLDSRNLAAYRFPDSKRRRTAAVIYLGVAIIGVALIPVGMARWFTAGGGMALAVWHFLAAWPLNLQAEEALTRSATDAPFPIGHASAAVIFSGWRSRPLWHVVLYDADSPPGRRALVVIDGVTGERVGDPYIEEVASRGTGSDLV